MKILYAVVECGQGDHLSAKERYVYSLALEAKKRGHKASVVCPDNSALFTYLTKVATTDIAVFPLHVSPTWPELNKLFAFYQILRKIKPNIVHFNCPKFGAMGSIVAKLAHIKKTIYTYHEWHIKDATRKNWSGEGGFIFMRKLGARIISRIALIANRKIITLSKKEQYKIENQSKVAKIAKLLGMKMHKKVTTIHNGLKPFRTLAKDDALIALIGEERAVQMIKNNKRIIGSIAKLELNKGYIYALEGLAQYKKFVGNAFNTHYIIVGDGAAMHTLQNTVENLGLDEDVTFVGRIREAREYIKAFDFLLSTVISDNSSHSTINTYPHVILEAGFAEVPVIATETGTISEVIENLKNGYLIPPARPAEIKHILGYIDEHLGKEREYAKNLKEKIVGIVDHSNTTRNNRAEFSFDYQVDKTFALY